MLIISLTILHFLPRRRHHPYNPPRKLVKVLRLENHLSGTDQLRQKQSLSAQKNIFQSFYGLDLIVDASLKGNHISRIHFENFTRRQILLHFIAVNFQKYHTTAADILQDKTFSAEQSGGKLFRKGYVQVHALLRAEKRPLLAD